MRVVGLDELTPFVETYAPLFAQLGELDPRKHTEAVAAYQNAMTSIFRRELTDVVETLKGTRMSRRSAEDKSTRKPDLIAHPSFPIVFTSLSSAPMGEKIIGLPGGLMGHRNIALVVGVNCRKIILVDVGTRLFPPGSVSGAPRASPDRTFES